MDPQDRPIVLLGLVQVPNLLEGPPAHVVGAALLTLRQLRRRDRLRAPLDSGFGSVARQARLDEPVARAELRGRRRCRRIAFGLEEAFAGGMGAAIAMGVRRGLFSNEAGLGSAPNVAAVAYVRHPASQGIVQAFSVFIDTLIICSCTAFMILLSGIYSPELQESSGVALTQSALADHVGAWGRSFVSIALMLFAFSSMIYNYYLGENSLNFFSEENKTLFNGFRVLTLALVLWGSLQDLGTAFGFADVTMGLLAVVNLAAVVLLIKVGLRIMRDYDEQKRAGIEHPVFDAAKFADLNIDRDAWTLDQPAVTARTQPAV